MPEGIAILKFQNNILGTKIWAKKCFDCLKPILMAFGHLLHHRKYKGAFIKDKAFVRINTVYTFKQRYFVYA